jgi:hypothetical protein
MYGSKIHVPTDQDRTNAIHQCFEEYEKRRLAHKLWPGEDPGDKPGREFPYNQISVMQVNGLVSRLIVEQNPDREFYVEESFPLEWMYPHLVPNGLIMRIHRQALTEIPEEALRKDHEYWSKYLAPRIGDWLKAETPLAEVTAYSERVYLTKDFIDFSGDRQFVQDLDARQAFSKLRSSIAGVYAWRLGLQCPPEFRPKSKSETERLRQEADFAFRQALAICPTSPEAVFRYANFLIQFNRMDDALAVATLCQKLDPRNVQIENLVRNLRQFAEQRSKKP